MRAGDNRSARSDSEEAWVGASSRLRIGIDARDLLVPQRTGVERVAYHFIEALGRVGQPHHQYVPVFDRQPPEDLLGNLPGDFEVLPVGFPRCQRFVDLWIAWQIRGLMSKLRLDVFVTLNTKFPLASRSCYATVHGLEWYHCPAEYRRSERIKQWAWFNLCSRYSDGVITFAQNTLSDIRRLRPDFDIPVCVVPEGIAPIYRKLEPAERDGAILDRLGIARPYVLSVCSLEPRKNLPALMRAFAKVVRENRIPHRLVLVGRAGWKSSRLSRLAASLGIERRVHFTGFVSDDELLQIYNHADLFVYPSKYEGFGLPLLEAMACGVPVVTSNGSSLREVAGEAAVLVDPSSDADIAAGIARVLADDEIRERLIAAGLKRVTGFSWDQMTRGICQFIDDRRRRELGP